MVKKICNGEVELLDCFNGIEKVIDGEVFTEFSIDQIIKFKEMMSASLLLSGDEIFNQEKINYYSRLKKHFKVSYIQTEMDRYRNLMNNFKRRKK